MLDTTFPINHGFEYYIKEDEFRLYLNSYEYLLIWEIREKWEISFVDKEDNQTFLCKGDEIKVSESIKQIIRDIKIDYLFSPK